MEVVVGRNLGEKVVGTEDNATSPWEPLLMAVVGSPCASLEFCEFGCARLENGLTSIAKVAEQDTCLHTLINKGGKLESGGQHIRHRPFHGISRTSYTLCTSNDTNALSLPPVQDPYKSGDLVTSVKISLGCK